MTISKSEYEKLDSVHQAEHQEGLMNIFNEAFFKIRNLDERKDIVDLINIYAGVRFQSRLFKIATGYEQYYGMFPIELGDKKETSYLQSKLSNIFRSSTVISSPEDVDSKVTLTSDEIDGVMENLTQRFIDESITYEDLKSGLECFILKEAEIELLRISGRITEGGILYEGIDAN